MGYFLGAVCVSFNYQFALGILLLLILLAMPWAILGEHRQHGQGWCACLCSMCNPTRECNAGLLACCLLACAGLSNQLGRVRSKKLGLTEIFKQKYNVNVLSVSRWVAKAVAMVFARAEPWWDAMLVLRWPVRRDA